MESDAAAVTDWPAGQLWIKLHQYIATKAGGKSVTGTDVLFDASKVNIDDWLDGLTMVNPVDVKSSSIALTFDDPWSAEVKTAVTSLSSSIWKDLGLLMAPSVPPPAAAPSQGLNRDDFKEFAHIMGQSQQNTKTSSEKQHEKNMKKTSACYQILLGRYQLGQFTPAELSPAFLQILDPPQATTAQQDLAQWAGSLFIDSRKSTHYLARAVHWSSQVANGGFTHAYRGFNWCTNDLDTDCTAAKKQISLINFLRPDTKSNAFQKIDHESHDLASATAVVAADDFDKCISGLNSGALFTKGRCFVLNDVLLALRNLRCLFKGMLKDPSDYDACLIGATFLRIDNLLESDKGRKCNDGYSFAPQPAVHVLLEVQKVLSNMVELAKNTRLIGMV